MACLKGPGWEIKGVSGLLFDKDGTLIDSHLYWGEIVKRRAKAVQARYLPGGAIFERLCSFMGYDVNARRLLPSGPVALVSRQKVIDALMDGMRSEGLRADRIELEDIFGRVMEDFNRDILSYISVLPGTEELLREAKAEGLRLALVTSDSVVSTEKILEHTSLLKYFSSVVGRETVKEDKSTGGPALKALAELGLSGGEVAAVGDAPVDAEMASRAGLKAAILVSSGQIPAADLAKCSGFVSESLSDLKILPAAI